MVACRPTRSSRASPARWRRNRPATHPTIYPNRPTVLGMDTFLQNWTVTIFLPAILIGLAILVVVVKVKDRD